MDENEVQKSDVSALSGDMIINDIIRSYPGAINILMACGMYCVTCPASLAETLAEACEVHGLDLYEILNILKENLK